MQCKHKPNATTNEPFDVQHTHKHTPIDTLYRLVCICARRHKFRMYIQKSPSSANKFNSFSSCRIVFRLFRFVNVRTAFALHLWIEMSYIWQMSVCLCVCANCLYKPNNNLKWMREGLFTLPCFFFLNENLDRIRSNLDWMQLHAALHAIWRSASFFFHSFDRSIDRMLLAGFWLFDCRFISMAKDRGSVGDDGGGGSGSYFSLTCSCVLFALFSWIWLIGSIFIVRYIILKPVYKY